MSKKYKIKNGKLVEFVNFYEPLWYELCDVYSLGYIKEDNTISKEEIKMLNIYVDLKDFGGKKYLTAYVGSDNNAIVYEDFFKESEEYDENDFMEFFEIIIE